MKNIILSTIFVLFFSACSTTYMNFSKDSALNINYDEKTYLLSQVSAEAKYLNFKDLYVKQYKTKTLDGGVLFYEYLKTDLSFEFNFGGLSTVMYLFDDSRKYEKVYKKNNLTLVQIMLKDGSYVNVIIQDSSTQVYSFVYGFSNEEFVEIAKAIKDEKDEITSPKFKAITFDNSSKPCTNWNTLLVYFTPLITPLRDLRSF